MEFKTLVSLAILVATIFWIGVSQGIKCFQCRSEDNGEGCHKAESSYLKSCGDVDGDGGGGGKLGCFEAFALNESEKLTVRFCSGKPLTPDPTCHVVKKGDPIKDFFGQKGTNSNKTEKYPYDGKVCLCYDDGCNKNPWSIKATPANSSAPKSSTTFYFSSSSILAPSILILNQL